MSQIGVNENVGNVVVESCESKAEVKVETKKFRLKNSKIGLTYPQCPIPKDTIVGMLETVKGKKCSIIVVARENHKDGNYHLHIYLEYAKPFTTTVNSVFDVEYEGKKYHPNIQSIESKTHWLTYITKDDDDYVEKGINVVGYLKASKLKKSSFFYEEVVEKEAITYEMIKANPKSIKGLKNLQNDLIAFKLLPKEADLIKVNPLTKVNIWGVDYEVMPRVHKQPQLWICGPKNTGKTSFLIKLKELGYKGYEMPTNDDWSGYDDTYDYLFIDEYRGGLTIQMLNKILEGVDCRLNTKGGVAWKQKNLPVFIISNYRPEEVYNKVEDDKLDTLLCRLTIVEHSTVRSINITTENSVKSVNPVKSLENDVPVSGVNLCSVNGVNDLVGVNSAIGVNEVKCEEKVESSVEFCNSCGGWSLNGKCACNACDICFSVKCEGCQKVWNEEAQKWIMPRPRKRVIRY